MSWKRFTLVFIWTLFSVLWILLLTVHDKEWWIGTNNINNFCDLINAVEDDDTRDVGILVTLPLFFPVLYALFIKKKRFALLYIATFAVAGFWLWRFYFRYQWCF
ncbi:YjeO family protein [Trabulsiella odontotermitis]|uniref:Membrane protein n=1 Tax=Trabulsiella odontotermitis TaxID=379893 RepID=A0A0L0GVS8_9ENTR|nr:YjeO family protein [Trabulsiella odontotermitis]KNC93230.1 membrane protein [Trabulsiella odontotermitis]